MSDPITPMSMFDYDSRPATPGVILVGTRASRGAYAIRDFLSRNGYPFARDDAAQPDAVPALSGAAAGLPAALPLCNPPDRAQPGTAGADRVMGGGAVLFASGREWRRLDERGVDDLLGAGVYYGAGPSEALACTGSRVVVVGGGNSAGQAVVRFSRYAQQVTLLVRGSDLGASMSQYLIDDVTAIPNVDVRVRTPRFGAEAHDPLPPL